MPRESDTCQTHLPHGEGGVCDPVKDGFKEIHDTLHRILIKLEDNGQRLIVIEEKVRSHETLGGGIGMVPLRLAILEADVSDLKKYRCQSQLMTWQFWSQIAICAGAAMCGGFISHFLK